MCPHAVALPLPHHASERGHYTLTQSEIGSHGFLPEQLPLDSLSDPYYDPWESLINDLPKLLKDATIRSRVDALPVLSVSRLKTTPKLRRAYVILSFIAHGYIWGGDHAAEVLPPPITVPLLQVSAHLDLPPVATYASTCLWNFRSSSTDLTRLDSLQALHTFTGTEDESWFYTVSVAMEAQGAPIIPTMLRALQAVKSRDHSTVTHALDELSTRIRRIRSLLGRMYEKCDPTVFYHQIRPFLAGSKNMAAAGLPRGVFYDEGEGQGRWLQLRGGSNGQSSLIQFLDVVLGVEHTSSRNSSPDAKKTTSAAVEPSFHREVRAHMPAAHRQFLEDVARMGSIRDMVGSSSLPGEAPEQQERLRAAFRTATGALAEFRNRHLEIVTRYIIIPSRRPPLDRGNVLVGLAGASVGMSLDGKERGELTGTGGTALLPFLKQVRDETWQAGCLESGAQLARLDLVVVLGLE